MTKVNTDRSRNDKKALVTTGAKKRHLLIPLTIVALLLAGAAGAGFYLTGSPDRPASPDSSAFAVQAASGEFSYSLDDFADGKARFYEHAVNGLTIKYFIIKSSDGVVRAAFDACDVCWRSGKGYAQESDYMVCRNCGRRFQSTLINEVQGGCNPAPLRRTVEDDRLIIRVQDIVPGQRYFDLI